MATPADIENLRAVFKKIMVAHQLRPEDVERDSQRKKPRVNIADRGEFDCEECTNRWDSNFSWITFHLVELEISYRWRMKCKVCLCECAPTFSLEQVEAMFERAVRWYKGDPMISNINIGHHAQRQRRQPHMPLLCEKCKWGIDPGFVCWLRGRCY